MEFGSGFAVVLAFLVFVAVTVAKGVRIVPQGEEWIVERLGRYHSTLKPGLNLVIPYLDRIAYQLVTKDIILDVQEQEVITRDNAVILTNAIAFVKVTDPVKAVYGVTDFSEAIRNMIMTTLRSIVGEMELDAALSSRDKIKARLRESIADEAVDWGLTVKSVMLSRSLALILSRDDSAASSSISPTIERKVVMIMLRIASEKSVTP
jgi:regulator of protease activity HflC (stomatin/prohibitin superfamily)